MDWENKTIGFAMCGSFCTFKKAVAVLELLTQTGANVIPIMSEISYNTDTRFGKAEDFRLAIKNITGNDIISCVKEAEPIGPKNLLDLWSYCLAQETHLPKLQTATPTHPLQWQLKHIFVIRNLYCLPFQQMMVLALLQKTLVRC